MELDISDRVQVMNKYNLMANYCLYNYSITYQDYPHICLYTQGVRSNWNRLHGHQELSLHPVLWSPPQVRFLKQLVTSCVVKFPFSGALLR